MVSLQRDNVSVTNDTFNTVSLIGGFMHSLFQTLFELFKSNLVSMDLSSFYLRLQYIVSIDKSSTLLLAEQT